MTVARVVVGLVAVWLAVMWHSSVTGQKLFLGQKPDLVLIAVCLVGIRSRPALGAGYGFLAGALQGGAAGADLTALAATRTLLGFGSSWVARSGLQFSPLVVGVVVAIGTLLAQGLFLIVAPPSDIGAFLGATLGTAIYNGVLASLLDAVLKRTLDPRTD